MGIVGAVQRGAKPKRAAILHPRFGQIQARAIQGRAGAIPSACPSRSCALRRAPHRRAIGQKRGG
ncbi:hypothetical protein [Thermoflexus sp.]|uniref:hypothetical protein n=1 Tax=Thermoflexus sp. TaxID=1969742 RepID=UPI0035E43F83